MNAFLIPLSCAYLPEHLVVLVVLVRGDEEVRVALLAGEVRGAGIRRDQDRAAVGHRLHHRDQDVGEHRADHEIDLVALDERLGLADRDVGLELVVLHDQLDLAPAELAAERLQRELEAVALLHAERRGRARQRGQDADLELVLRGGLRGDRGQAPQRSISFFISTPPEVFFVPWPSMARPVRRVQWRPAGSGRYFKFKISAL